MDTVTVYPDPGSLTFPQLFLAPPPTVRLFGSTPFQKAKRGGTETFFKGKAGGTVTIFRDNFFLMELRGHGRFLEIHF